uniref:Uncharacterized protein n=1 Tax=Anguilla anguilla TaxID=7936 RepID=A0A0E9QWY4_ANGAN
MGFVVYIHYLLGNKCSFCLQLHKTSL